MVNQYLYWFLQAFAGKGLPLRYLGELFFYASGKLIVMAFYIIDSQARTMTFHQFISPLSGAWASIAILSPIAFIVSVQANKH